MADQPEPSPELAQLLRWERAGGTWELLALRADAVTISLRRCDAGEEADRLTSTSADLRDHVLAAGAGKPADTAPRARGTLGVMAESDNEDLKAKMREALERKKANDGGVEHTSHDRGRAETRGPAGGKRVHRRKSG